LNRLERRDEKPFELVAEVSALGEKAYTLFGRPFVRPLVNERTAELGRMFHPLRWQRWALSDLNPWLWPLPALASAVKSGRRAAPVENPYRRLEKAASDMITAGFDLYRDLRDAGMEALFFQWYGPAAVSGLASGQAVDAHPPCKPPRELPAVGDALAKIGKGGYPEAVALIGALIGKGAGRIPLSRLTLIERMIRGDDVLSHIPGHELRRIRAEQAVIAELEPERGLRSLTRLLADPADRKRAMDLLEEAAEAVTPTADQQAMIDRIREELSCESDTRRRAAPTGAK
jgi:hypothetical protein